ncbi:anion permease, partial [Proteus mirabilis]
GGWEVGRRERGTGTGPIMCGSGHASLGEGWKGGFVMSIVNLIIWITLGSLWWKVLGYW